MQSLDAAATVASFIFKSHIIYTHHLIHSADTEIAPFSRRGPHNRTMYAVRYIRYTMLQIWDSFGAGRGRRAFPFSVLFCFFIFFFLLMFVYYMCVYFFCYSIQSNILQSSCLLFYLLQVRRLRLLYYTHSLYCC